MNTQTKLCGRLAKMLLVVLAACGSAQGAETAPSASAPLVSIPTDPAELRELVAGLGRKMFDAYNDHDVDRLMSWFSEDLEFYHDNGGLLDFQQVKSGFTSVFANNKDIRRDLVDGSLEVYPIKGYGAIEIGAHRFCHTESGKEECGTFRFMQIWRFSDGAWKVSREVSYGH